MDVANQWKDHIWYIWSTLLWGKYTASVHNFEEITRTALQSSHRQGAPHKQEHRWKTTTALFLFLDVVEQFVE